MVQAVPAGDARWQVSAGAGDFPAWRRDGRELYYVGAGKLMAVPVTANAGSFHAGTAERLFDVSVGSERASIGHYWPSADGRRFLVSVPAEGTPGVDLWTLS